MILAGFAVSMGAAFLYYYETHDENNIFYFGSGIAAVVIGYKEIKIE